MATSFLTVETPTRTAPLGGLMAVANVIDSSDPHLAQGLTFVPDACDLPLLTPGSCWVTENPVPTEKTFEGIGDPVTSPVTFVLHAGVECFVGPDQDFDRRARQVLDFGESIVVEAILRTNLLDPAASIGTEANIQSAVARAEQYLSANYPALGLIHADRRQTSLGIAAQSLLRVGSRIETGQGVPVANGGGYGSLTGAATADPEFIFATGQVNIWRTEVVQTDTVDWTHNTALALVERQYAITIDCGLIAKITLDTTP